MTNVLKNTAAMEVIAKMYLNEELADVHFVFKVDDDDVQKVPANKNVLAALSPVFYTMFYGSLKEGSDVKIVDASAGAFKEFLQFFYLAEVNLTMENIEIVARLADKYDVLQYINTCATFVKSQLTPDNMCWGYQLAMFLKNDELIEFCEEKIAISPKEIFATEVFQRCDKSALNRILKLDLTCEEINVFDACLTWAKYACKMDDLDETQAVNLRTKLGDCLKLIRFGSMKSDEFSARFQSHKGLFTSEEFQDIMLSFTLKDYVPIIFNQNPRRLKWNENEILMCQRVLVNNPTSYLKDTEVILFTSNQTLLLGEIFSATTYKMSYIDEVTNAVNVTIAELNIDFSKRILYEGSSNTWVDQRLKVSLNHPIIIKPNVMYEVHFDVIIGVNILYYCATWKSTVELKNGLTIQFHRNPTHKHYDMSSSGWIQSLGFNNI